MKNLLPVTKIMGELSVSNETVSVAIVNYGNYLFYVKQREANSYYYGQEQQNHEISSSYVSSN